MIFLLTVATGLFVLIFISPMFIPLDIAKTLSEMFYNVGLGFGAFVAALAGYKTIDEMLNEAKIKRTIGEYKSQYPLDKHPGKFRLIVSVNDKGRIFLHNKENNTRRWVSSYKTFQDLDFPGLPRDELTQDEFDKIPLGPDIHTRGAKGS